jgi:hypothetical protein
MKQETKCNCKHCSSYDLYRWATIMECKCSCHDDKKIVGHDSLCCEFANGKREDNPYNELDKASNYKKIIDDFLL